MNRTQTRRAFGLPADPWSAVRLDTADTHAVADMVDAAIGAGDGYTQALVQIVGPPGAGKSVATWAALRRSGLDAETDVIQVQRLDRDQRTIADIVSACYRTLGQPRPTRAEDRDAQLRQVLGQAATSRRADGRRRKLVLVIDDAHHLHWRTVSALKGLRELSWLGHAPLVGVILLSQRDVLCSRAEIRERSDTYQMAGPSAADADTALAQVLGERCDAEARAALSRRATTWNRLIWDVDQAMAAALAAGRRRIERADAIRAVGADLRELVAASPLSQRDLARATGASPTQVSRVISGDRRDPELEASLLAILLRDQSGSAEPAAEVRSAGRAA